MSAIFGKKNYRSSLESLISSGDFKGALEETVRAGDSSYELGKVDEAINIFETLLDILLSHSVNNPQILVKVYEKLAPLYFEVNNIKKGAEATLSVVENKIALKQTSEAIEILKLLEVQFSSDFNLMNKIIETYVSLGYLSNALKLVQRIVQAESKISPDLLRIGGELSYRLGRFDDAIGYFNTLLTIISNDKIALQRVKEINESKHSKNAGTSSDILQKAPSSREDNRNTTESQENIKKKTGIDNSEKQSLEQKLNEIEDKKGKAESTTKEPLSPQLVKDEPGVSGIRLKEKFQPNIEEQTAGPSQQAQNLRGIERESIEKATGVLKNPSYIQALEEIKLGHIDQASSLLLSLASGLESTNLQISEYIYLKAMLLDPSNIQIALKLAETYKAIKYSNEEIFYLRAASKNAKGEEKLKILRELSNVIPYDVEVIKDIFDGLTQLNKISEAIAILEKTPSKELIDSFATRLVPYVREDSSSLLKVAHILKKNNIFGQTYYQYAYLLGKLLFASGEQPEAIKWFISAHGVNKLPLEDYVEIANYIKDIPLDDEKTIFAEAIFGYLDTVEDVNKKLRLTILVLELKPDKVPYMAKYLGLLIETKNFREAPKTLLSIAKTNSLSYWQLVYDSTMKLIDTLDVDSLVGIAQFLELADKKEESSKIYSVVLERDPLNEIAVLKNITGKVESESVIDMLHLFDGVKPSHTYSDSLLPLIEKYKVEQTKNPFDYHSHFVLGFMYFFTERYEEAIASFQFVVRSHHFESFMRLFLGVAFEKILLEDFAIKQYQMGLAFESSDLEIRLALLYRVALINKARGLMSDYRKSLEEIISLNPNYKNVKETLMSLPDNGKIIGINEEENR